jgi:hypothetical protein
VSRFDPPAGPSRSTVEGQAIGFVSDLSGQQGWRRRVGRIIAYVALIGFVVAVIAIGLVIALSD